MRNSRKLWTWIAVVALFALIAAACGQGTTTESTTTTAAPAATTTTAGGSAATTTTAATPGIEGFTYKIGIFEDLTTDNYWAVLDTESSAWNFYVLTNQHPALFTQAPPGWQIAPDVAAGAPNLAEQVGDDWVITQTLRQDYMWSDGTPVTAQDFAFTWNTVVDTGLGGNWPSNVQAYVPDDPATADVDETQDGVKSYEAVDDYTVKITWSSDPGLATWQMGVAQMSAMPQHFWQATVDEALASDDPAATLDAASGEGEPSGSGLIYAGREPGAFAKNVTNPDYYYAHTTYTFYSDGTFQQANADKGFDEMYQGSGTGDITVQYTEGPYAKDVIYSVYSDQNAAILALKSGEIDFLLNPLSLNTGLKNEVLNSPNLSLVANGSNGWRYLAFNMRKSPGKYKGFRQAVGCLTDKEFLQTLLGGAIIPAYSAVPEGNLAFANPDVPRICQGLSQQERFEQALQYMKDDGFTWDVEPAYDDSTAGTLIPDTGTGLKDPDGKTVPELELLAPGPGYDPLRSTASIWIAQWAGWMGIPVQAKATGFNVILDKVFPPADMTQWDMYILGWGLGNPALPDFFPDFWASWSDAADGGFNTPGYSDPDFDELATEFLAAKSFAEAKPLVKAMDQKIVEDLPYVILFTTPILDVYSNDITLPFTDVLDGISNLNGQPTSAQSAS